MTKTFQISGFRKACPRLVVGLELENMQLYLNGSPLSRKEKRDFQLTIELSLINYKLNVRFSARML